MTPWQSIKDKFARSRDRQQRRKSKRRCLELLVQANGLQVMAGPFAGMAYVQSSHCGQILPKLVGSYEAPLQAWMQDIVKRRYRRILNVGCAEGYYAVGLARACPDTEVLAFDIERQARGLCRKLGGYNRIDNLQIHGLCSHETFENSAGAGCLVLMDVEGAENELVDPERAPALRDSDLIVELHDFKFAKTRERLLDRLSGTHNLELIKDEARQQGDFPSLSHLPPELRALAINERRPPGMEWLRAISRS